MSITDTTTTLDTAWTEQSEVQFTAGVLSSIDECVTEVEAALQRGTLSTTTVPTLANTKNWLRWAKLALAETKDYTWKRKFVSASLSAGDYRVGLPEDYESGGYLRDTTNDRYIHIVGSDLMDKKYPDLSAETQNEPTLATIKNMELWVNPPVDATTTFELEYQRSGAETTADDFGWLPEIERFRCCDFAKWKAFLSLHMWEVALLYERLWNEGLRKSLTLDGRRKWKRRVSCMNIFQEYAALGYQPSRIR